MASRFPSLKCGYVNIQSMGNKTIEIREKINDNKIDILAISENINTRRDYNHALTEPRCLSNYGFRSFFSAAPRLFNSLPKELSDIPETKRFKKDLKTYLFSNCYDRENQRINEDYRC